MRPSTLQHKQVTGLRAVHCAEQCMHSTLALQIECHGRCPPIARGCPPKLTQRLCADLPPERPVCRPPADLLLNARPYPCGVLQGPCQQKESVQAFTDGSAKEVPELMTFLD